MNLLKELARALLNATLILVALCLLLLWQLSASMERVSSGLAASAQAVAPLRADLQAVSREVAGLRADLAAAPTRGTLDARAAAVTTRLDGIEEKLAAFTALPDEVSGRLGARVADGVAGVIERVLGCARPDPGA
jgi:hypothetical protein